jgi:hypothetical protein
VKEKGCVLVQAKERSEEDVKRRGVKRRWREYSAMLQDIQWPARQARYASTLQ